MGHFYGWGRRLAGGGGKPEKVPEDLDADGKDPGPIGVIPKDIRFFKAVV